MNKKWIVIPDIHGRKFRRDVVKGNEKERIISLADVSIFRVGPDTSGSVVWTDIEEFIYCNYEIPGYIQLFGHMLHIGGMGNRQAPMVSRL